MDRRVASEANIVNILWDFGQEIVGVGLNAISSGEYGIFLYHSRLLIFTKYAYSLFKRHLNGYLEDQYKTSNTDEILDHVIINFPHQFLPPLPSVSVPIPLSLPLVVMAG